MNSKLLKLFFLLFTVIALISCSVGGKNEEEGLGEGSYYLEPEEACEGPPAFTYSVNPDNADSAFNAYGRTQIRIIHTGQCLYSLELVESSSGETVQLLTEGFGNVNLLRVYDLPENQYIIKSSAETGCTWNLEIESLEIVGCGGQEADEI